MKKYFFRCLFVIAVLFLCLFYLLDAILLKQSNDSNFSFSEKPLSVSISESIHSESVLFSDTDPDKPGSARNAFSNYHYDQLNDTQKITYIEMYQTVSQFLCEKEITPVSKHDSEIAFRALCADHPELFWVNSFSAKFFGDASQPASVIFVPGYCDPDAAPQTTLLLEERRAKLLSQMQNELSLQENSSQWHQAKWLLQQLCNTTVYDDSVANGQELRSALLDGHSVCAGYTRALQYLLMGAGIESSFVSGTAKGESHAWLLVNLDGNWCYMDPTWADTDCLSYNGENNELIHWEYAFMTDSTLSVDHIADSDCWPPVSSDNCLYVTKNSGLFACWQPEQISVLMTQAAQSHNSDLFLSFRGEDCWQQTVSAIDRGDLSQIQFGVSQLVPSLKNDSVMYYRNEEQKVVHIILQYTP